MSTLAVFVSCEWHAGTGGIRGPHFSLNQGEGEGNRPMSSGGKIWKEEEHKGCRSVRFFLRMRIRGSSDPYPDLTDSGFMDPELDPDSGPYSNNFLAIVCKNICLKHLITYKKLSERQINAIGDQRKENNVWKTCNFQFFNMIFWR